MAEVTELITKKTQTDHEPLALHGVDSEVMQKHPQPEKLTVESLGGLKVEEVGQQEQHINMFIYGESGVGKTVLAGSASVVPEMSPVIMLNLEKGQLSLVDRYPDVKVVRPKTAREIQRVYDDLYRGKHPFKTVVLDSGSDMQKTLMGEVMVDVYNSDSDRDPDVPGMYEWNKNTWQIGKIIRAFRDLPMHTIVTAWSEERKPKSGIVQTVPLLSNKLSVEVPALMDVVVYMYLKKTKPDEPVKRLLLTKKTDKEVAKDRTGKLPPVIEEPTMQAIYDLIFNGQAQ